MAALIKKNQDSIESRIRPNNRIPPLSSSALVREQLSILAHILEPWNRRSDEKDWNLETPSPYIPMEEVKQKDYAGTRI